MQIQLRGILPFLCYLSVTYHTSPVPASPLAAFSKEWNDSKYLQCNTAGKANYMSAKEKEVIYILNLLRTDPKLFANTVVKKYPEYSGQRYLFKIGEYKSLLNTLQKMKPLPLLYPDELCYASAECHAYSSGKNGYVGHDRKEGCRSKKHFNGECCDYGHDEPLAILMSLLIDEHIASLGHRMICLSKYKKIGVSIEPHKSYGYNTVVDFIY